MKVNITNFGWLVTLAIVIAILNAIFQVGMPYWMIIAIPFIPLVIPSLVAAIMGAVGVVIMVITGIVMIIDAILKKMKNF